MAEMKIAVLPGDGIGPFLVMLGANYHHIFKWKHPFVTKGEKGFEFPLTLLLVALALILLGGGAYSIDAFLGW